MTKPESGEYRRLLWRTGIAGLGILGCNLAAQDGRGGRTGDNDFISTAVELNPPNRRLYGFDTTVNDPDPSRARGTVTTGTLESGINLPDAHANYYHYLGDDPTDSDDWGTLSLLNLGESVAVDWGDPFRPCLAEIGDPLPPTRFGIGDLSLGNEATRTFGGETPDHESHENGRDMDLRYLRRDNAEIPLDLAIAANHAFYDTIATVDLLGCFLSHTDVERILVDTRYLGIDISGFPQFVHDTGHHNHFHVRITDPDGTAN